MSKKVYFKTFGCRTNLYDSQVMMSKLDGYEVVDDEAIADIVIVNSCTVTNGADSSVRSYINSINKNDSKKVFLTGCGAHTKGEQLLMEKKVAGVFGQSEKQKISEMLSKKEPFYELGDLAFVDDSVVDDFVGKSRAFIKIQEGCSFRCSYCVIPYVRGDARSMSEEKILDQISRLASNGYGEFILTGTNVGSYGRDRSTSIAKLMKKISQIRGVRRVRVGSIEPIQLDDEFREILREPWLERHLHIALQHTSEQMLRVMNRRNIYKQDRELFEYLSDLGFAIGTDFITGHPGESSSIWQEAVENLLKLPLTHIHAFSYSPRDGTKSASMGDIVSGDVAKKRLHEIEEIVKQKNYEFRVGIKNELDILVESKKDDIYMGYDQYFNKIFIKSNEDLVGNWIKLDSFEADTEYNYARV